ncbi:MAG: pilus (MSHA type) biogenesis protein MshL [Pseudomonadota bacterium]
MLSRFTNGTSIGLALLLLTACANRTPHPIEPSQGHLYNDAVAEESAEQVEPAAAIPEPVTTTPYLPAPEPQSPEDTYTVVVNQVPLRDLLFALARDARLNIDIVGDINGRVTLNAIDQSLIRILDRIALQAPIRYEVGDDYLVISADAPYLQTYAIDYLNLTRSATSRVDLATQVGSISVDIDGDSGSSGGGSNNSRTQVENSSENLFWDSLVSNIQSILGVSGSDQRDEALERVIVHRESGFISVRGTRRQHHEVQAFIDKILRSARRQVLIEATIVEVTLSDTYQAGIDWRVLADTNDTSGFSAVQSFTGGPAATGNVVAPNFLLSYSDTDSSIGSVLSTLKLLDQFGDVQILSSPKIIALNNQAAVLKVVDNRVYFTISVDPAVTNANGIVTQPATRETEIHTVPVGFVMNVTPFISDNEEVILNVRPTISRILGFVNDPNPDLAAEDVVNRIPEIQVREMESLLRVNSGQVAIIGGLMQDKVEKGRSSVPGLGEVPVLGNAFSYRDDTVEKTELLVFLRPTVVNNASLDGDLKAFKSYLPDQQEFSRNSQSAPEEE